MRTATAATATMAIHNHGRVLLVSSRVSTSAPAESSMEGMRATLMFTILVDLPVTPPPQLVPRTITLAFSSV